MLPAISLKMNLCSTFGVNQLLIIVVISFADCQKNCPLTLFGKDNFFHVISTYQTDGNSARRTCSSSGGGLTVADSSTQKLLITQSFRTLVPPGLSSVQVRENPTSPFRFKYRPKIQFKDTFSTNGWKPPKRGFLRKFLLYTQPTSLFNREVRFCHVCSRDAIRSRCNQNWNYNYRLYAGSNAAVNVIPLYNYNYFIANLFSTILSPNDSLTRDDVKQTGNLKLNRNSTILIPDISIFIGATSDVNQSTWHWDNGTIVNNTMFPTANSSICQQMTWPLTYDDGINLRSKRCEKRSYYICQIQFSISVDGYSVCNGSYLRITWNQLHFQQITGENFQLSLQIKISETNLTSSFPFNTSQALFRGLEPRTIYNVHATVFQNKCSSFKVIATSSGRTGFGILEPRIVNSTQSTCQLEWVHSSADADIMHYKIVLSSGNITNSFLVDIPIEAVNNSVITNYTLQRDVDLSSFPFSSSVAVQIQAKTCSGFVLIENVGNCTSTGRIRRPTLASLIWIIPVSVVVVLIIVTLLPFAYVHCKKKRVKEEDRRKLEEEPPREVYLEVVHPHVEDPNDHEYEVINEENVGYIDMSVFQEAGDYVEVDNPYEVPIPSKV